MFSGSLIFPSLYNISTHSDSDIVLLVYVSVAESVMYLVKFSTISSLSIHVYSIHQRLSHYENHYT